MTIRKWIPAVAVLVLYVTAAVCLSRMVPGKGTDARLRSALPVELLDLSTTDVTDSGLSSLTGWHDLQVLDLSHTGITDQGLRQLSNCKSLQVLNLGHTAVTDRGLKHLNGLNELRVLVLCNTRVTDTGIAHLTALENLETVCLSNTALTDAAVPHLTRLSKLSTLHIIDTPVTAGGVDDVQSALPNCKITTKPARASGLPSGDWVLNFAMVLGFVVVMLLAAVFFYLGFVTGGKPELRPYVAIVAVLLVGFVGFSVYSKGLYELLGLSPFIAWMFGVISSEGKVYFSSLRRSRR